VQLPVVLEKIEHAVTNERRKLHEVSARMMADEPSMLQPCDRRQVKNVAHCAQPTTSPTNAADELQVMIGSIHDHAFVKEVCVRHGQSHGLEAPQTKV